MAKFYKKDLNQHQRHEYCTSRPNYRASKQLTAVKVYTIANESKHILIFGVPKINLQNEIKRELQKYGETEKILCITNTLAQNSSADFELEQFTDCYHIEFKKLEHARKAKKFLDAKNFYGGLLHISYAPEYETISDLREKLQKRKSEVLFRMKLNNGKSVPGTGKRKLGETGEGSRNTHLKCK